MSHPEPFVRSRRAAPEEMPSAARSFRKASMASGWAVEGRYALGWAPGTGKAGTEALTSSVILTGRRDDGRFVAGWAGSWRWPDGTILRRRDVVDIDPEPEKINPWRRFVAVRTYWHPLDPFARPDEDLPIPPERWTYELGTHWVRPHPPLGGYAHDTGWLHPDGRAGGWLSAADLKTRVKEKSE